MEAKIVKKENAIVKSNGTSPADLLQLAIEKDVDIEKLSKLMDLQERWDAQQAKKAFLIAKSEFQSRCPVLHKSKRVGFTSKKTGSKVDYSYVPLGSIANQIKELLNECGLSYCWKTKEDAGRITITCIVSHIDGHSEENSMTAGKDDSGMKNQIQQIGSTMTYLQRYSLIGALGISTADMDVDGEQPKEKPAKLTKEASSELLSKAKIIINEYNNVADLQKNSRPFIQEQVKLGLNDKDRKELATYITIKYEQLNTKN